MQYVSVHTMLNNKQYKQFTRNTRLTTQWVFTNINNAIFTNTGRDCGANQRLHSESLSSCQNLAVE